MSGVSPVQTQTELELLFPLKYCGPALILLQEVISILQELEVSKIRKHLQSTQSVRNLITNILLSRKKSSRLKYHWVTNMLNSTSLRGFVFIFLSHRARAETINHPRVWGTREPGRESVPVPFTRLDHCSHPRSGQRFIVLLTPALLCHKEPSKAPYYVPKPEVRRSDELVLYGIRELVQQHHENISVL